MLRCDQHGCPDKKLLRASGAFHYIRGASIIDEKRDCRSSNKIFPKMIQSAVNQWRDEGQQRRNASRGVKNETCSFSA